MNLAMGEKYSLILSGIIGIETGEFIRRTDHG